MNLGTLAAVADAVSSKSVFHIYYNPRASPSEFIIPLWKFAKSMNYSFSIGTRFKMRFESEDASERRYTGWVAGIGDVDPARWPGSKWKCLLVRWDDDDVDRSRQSRLSPWEIEPTGTVSGSTGLSASGSKRTKFCLPPANPDNPVSNGSGCVDLGESVRFHKVLQGQENFGSKASYGHNGVMSSRITEKQNHQYPEMRRSEFCYKRAGFGESVRFHKVLQGQEIFPANPYAENCVFGSFKGGNPSVGGREPVPIQGYSIFVPPSTPPVQVSSPSSVLTFQQNSQLPCSQSVYGSNTWNNGNNGSYLGYSYFPKFAGELNRKQCEAENSSKQGLKNEQAIGRNSCKVFGFSLTERIPVVDVVDDAFPASPTSADMNFEPSSPSSNPNSVEISCTKVSSLQAVCAATPF
ncbi:uncharacterized protein A4U43_C01F3180 [Asparagus officinalis]|uniref:Auxin response factor domain-containing protein n=2 Tax=Asparagus officinalis TaxID=4686 RepID=A0A5P1FM10_ASPOF|nr:uncharacterized protein A4U43_C01F3180 [Asparagus officinalis]